MYRIPCVDICILIGEISIVHPSLHIHITNTGVGLNGNYNLSEFGEKQLVAGLYYRLGDAIAPMLGLEINNIKFTFSYDVTLSSLNQFNGYRGASEFSIVKKGFYPQRGDRQTICPTFY